jgi:hypothetical protein
VTRPTVAWLAVLLLPVWAQAQESLQAHLALLGEQVTLTRIDPLTIEEPSHWVGRQAGNYTYRFTAGDDHGELEQIERHQPDPARPGQAWTRHIGENLIEQVEVVDGQAIRIYTETDKEHGYRVLIKPGVHLPAGLRVGDTWQSDNTLEVFELGEHGEPSHTGSLSASHRYIGTWRIRVPAGEFDAVLIHDDYELSVGPLKASDERYAFYARDVGLVAEVEGLRASALIVLRVKEDSAKVLVDYPRTGAQ